MEPVERLQLGCCETYALGFKGTTGAGLIVISSFRIHPTEFWAQTVYVPGANSGNDPPV